MIRVHVLGRLFVVFDPIDGEAAGCCINFQTAYALNLHQGFEIQACVRGTRKGREHIYRYVTSPPSHAIKREMIC